MWKMWQCTPLVNNESLFICIMEYNAALWLNIVSDKILVVLFYIQYTAVQKVTSVTVS